MDVALLALLALLLQTTTASNSKPSPFVDDVRRLSAAATNEARFDALTTMRHGRGLMFSVETFSIDKPLGREPRTEGRNIVVTLGDGPQDIVVGAHYDAARLPDGSLSRGAVDNAASSVMLVRVAEALRSASLPVRIRIVWFDMEELGLIGSARYVKQHAADPMTAMLNFDFT